MISVLGNLVCETCLLLDAPAGTEQRRVAGCRVRWGGSALNVAAVLGFQKIPAALVVAGPAEAGNLERPLGDLGIHLHLDIRQEAHRAWILHSGRERHIYFNEGPPPPFSQALFPGTDLLVTSGFDLLADPEGFSALVGRAFTQGVPVALDVGPAAARPDLLLPLCPKVRYLFLNLREGRRLTGRQSPEAVLESLMAPEVHLKLGALGALANIGGRLHRMAPPPVREIDPVGAGDAYLAGLLGHLGEPPGLRLSRACAWGAWASATEGAGDDWLAARRALTPSGAEAL